jgi:hypothetical protein
MKMGTAIFDKISSSTKPIYLGFLVILPIALPASCEISCIIFLERPTGYLPSISLAGRAIGNITRKPRYIGLGAGIITVLVFYIMYMFFGLRSLVTGFINNSDLHIVLDLFLVVAGGMFIGWLIEFFAARAMKLAIGHLFSNEKAAKRAMKVRGSGWFGYVGALLAFLVVLEATAHLSVDVPSWYSFVRGMAGL